MNYGQLKELFYQHEHEYPKTHLTAYITFASFGTQKKAYSWEGRTYLVSSDNKAFQPNMVDGCTVSRPPNFIGGQHGKKQTDDAALL